MMEELGGKACVLRCLLYLYIVTLLVSFGQLNNFIVKLAEGILKCKYVIPALNKHIKSY